MGGTSLANVLLSTSTFTTVFPTTSTVTSSSAIASCTIAQSADITCSDGYYNAYGSQWQEFCSVYLGDAVTSMGSGLSLRACMSACAVNSQCTGVYWDPSAKVCFRATGDLTTTPGGPFQAASRLSPDASPCISSWVVTETGVVTSTGEVVYTITTTPTPSASLPMSSTPVSRSPTGVSRSSTSVPPSSVPFLSSSIPTPERSSSSAPRISSPVSSPARLSSTPLIGTSTSRPLATGSPSIIPSSSSSVPSSGASSSPAGSKSSQTQPNSSATLLNSSTATAGGVSTSTQSADGSSGGVPVTSTYTTAYTVTETRPGYPETTYLTTETITRVTTICPEGSEATAPAHEGSGTAIAHTSVTQNVNPQQTGAYASSLTTSTVYVTEIDIITACPPSVHNCPVGQSSTYTTTRTVATQTTTYLVAVPTLSLAQPIAPGAQESGFASSVSSQASATMMNSVSGESTSATTSASGAVYPGEAPKMGPFSTLFMVLNVLLALLFL